MKAFELVSHEEFPEDPYVKELVYLLLDGKYRVAYVRKAAKNGGLFWSGISCAINVNGAKKYYEAFMQDSSFLDKDIKSFLDSAPWKTKSAMPKPVSDDLPF
jgi:hypothetical protein